jgi:hypothetical protein
MSLVKDLSIEALINFVFSSKGIACLAFFYGGVIALLTGLTATMDKYAPLSYGLAFPLGVFIVALLWYLFMTITDKIAERQFFKEETYLDVFYDGKALHSEDKSNIWGWQYFPNIIYNDANNVARVQWTISVCFNKQVSADTMRVRPLDSNNQDVPDWQTINYEERYANFLMQPKVIGKYRVEFKSHKAERAN